MGDRNDGQHDEGTQVAGGALMGGLGTQVSRPADAFGPELTHSDGSRAIAAERQRERERADERARQQAREAAERKARSDRAKRAAENNSWFS